MGMVAKTMGMVALPDNPGTNAEWKKRCCKFRRHQRRHRQPGAGAGWVDVANDLVKNFLGRPQNMAAFQKWMGEKFETRKLCTSLVTQTRGSFFPFRRLVFVRLCRGLKEHR